MGGGVVIVRCKVTRDVGMLVAIPKIDLLRRHALLIVLPQSSMLLCEIMIIKLASKRIM